VHDLVVVGLGRVDPVDWEFAPLRAAALMILRAPPVAIAPTPEAKAQVDETLDRVFAVFEPHLSSTVYPNFTERPSHPESLFGAASERLGTVKRTWDPRNVIRSNHPVSG